MTGFGRGAAREGAVEATVEVRSVNARFADVSVYVPRGLAPFEGEIRRIAKERLHRGTISVSVSIKEDTTVGSPKIDADAVRLRVELLRAIRDEARLTPDEAPITLDVLLEDDSLTGPDADETAKTESTWKVTQAALREALEVLEAMRLREGMALRDDLAERVKAIDASIDVIESRAPERVQEARMQLQQKISDLFGKDDLNQDRLEMEVALLVDKLDITEECVRLRSHLDQFREALEGEEPVGRRLNFLSQELNREMNTIGAKANDSGITRLSIAMKEELEKIREQVQNVV